MKKLRLLFVLALLIGAFSCRETEDVFFSVNDEIAFQFEYTNYAWGKQHYGFIITSDGTKYSFNNPENWISPENSIIKAEDLLTNLATCTNEGKVDLTELNRMKNLVLKVDETQLTKSQNTMYDAGSENYSFYVKDSAKGTFRQVTLLNRGDYFQKNADEDAQEIAEWLIQLNNGGIFKN